MTLDDADVTVPLLPDRWEQLAIAIIAHSYLTTCSYCGSCSPKYRERSPYISAWVVC